MNSPLTNPLVIKALELGATLLSQPCECVALAKKETTLERMAKIADDYCDNIEDYFVWPMDEHGNYLAEGRA